MLNIWKYGWDGWKHPIKNIKTFFHKIGLAKERVKYGFCHEDTWSANTYTASVIRDMLKYTANHNMSYPTRCESFDEWKTELLELSELFDKISSDDLGLLSYEEQKELVDKAFKELSKIYFNWWD